MNPIDALAISMLSVVFLSFGVVALLFFNIIRSASRHDNEIEELMREALAESEKPQSPAPATSTALDPWEREGDWWRKGE